MTIQAWAALAIFLGVIILAASGRMKTATASLFGASVMVASGLLSSEDAVKAIDHNTVGLLVGMMIVVGILSKSGLFQYLAVKAIKVTGGRPILIFWILSLLTAVLSAFLDNVTTVLLVTPVVLSLCELISMNPLPLLLMELFASNIGGTATLIGDPPNMIIASVAGFSFNDFIVILAPVAAVILCATTAYVAFYYKSELKSDPDAAERLKDEETPCAAVVSYVYNHHERQLAARMTEHQHEHGDVVHSVMHVHLNHEDCLEAIILFGTAKTVGDVANRILAEAGVRHGSVNAIPLEGAAGHKIPAVAAAEALLHAQAHAHGDAHDHDHAHPHEHGHDHQH